MTVNTHDSSNIYFNITIDSDFNQSTTFPQYNVQRTRNIIDKSSDYYLAIVRFTIPSFYIPILIFVPDPNFVNPLRGIYSVTLEINGVIVQQPLLYTYQGNGTNNSNKADFYYMYSFVHMATMINTAFESAFVTLGNATTVPAAAVAPYVVFSPTTKLFTLFADETYSLTSENVVTPIQIFFDDHLWSIIYALPHERLNQTDGFTSDGRDVQLLLQNYKNNWSDANDPNDGLQYLTLQQEYITLYSWNPYKKIVLETSLVPIQSEYTKGDGDSFQKILTDFSIPINLQDQRSTLQYLPTAQYRLIDLLSDDPLREVDVRVFWQDINGNTIPIAMPWNSQINIKMAFVSRNLYDQNIGKEELEKFNVRMVDRIEKTHGEQQIVHQRVQSKQRGGYY